MPPAQVNATLTLVRKAPSGERWDNAGPGAQLWAGSSRVYYRAERDRQQSAAGGEQVLKVELIVGTLDVPVDWRSGQLVTFTPDRGQERTARVKLAPSRDLAGVPAAVRTTKLQLEDL